MTMIYHLLVAHAWSAAGPLLLAQDEEEAGASYGIAFFLAMLCIVLGVMVTVRPDKRESDINR